VTLDRSLEAVARRDRAVTLAGLVALTLLAWLYLVRLHGDMTDMAAMGMAMEAWTAHDALMAVAMWFVMMIAMMLPSAAPMIVMFGTLNRKRRADAAVPHVNTALFAGGYLAMWGGFSVAAAAAQWALQHAALLAPATLRVGPAVGAAVLVVAAVYQVTPFKYACLARCQTPFGFLMAEWREGDMGTFIMGVRHGLFCLGCCWALMVLLFVGGVMNLAWVALLAGFVFVEKLVAHRGVSWASAALLLAGAVWMLSGR
jgi:predicted metal-binding membrane protein